MLSATSVSPIYTDFVEYLFDSTRLRKMSLWVRRRQVSMDPCLWIKATPVAAECRCVPMIV